MKENIVEKKLFLLKYYGMAESCQTFKITWFLVWLVIGKKGKWKKNYAMFWRLLFYKMKPPKHIHFWKGKLVN